MEEQISSQTEWNGGTLTNIRLHDIKEQLKVCSMNRDLDNWLTLLSRINHELHGFEKPKEREEIKLQLKQLAEIINLYNLRARSSRSGIRGIPPEIINSLNDIEYKLDEIFHNSGLQTALKDDAGDSF